MPCAHALPQADGLAYLAEQVAEQPRQGETLRVSQPKRRRSDDRSKADHESKFGKLRILDKQTKNMPQRILVVYFRVAVIKLYGFMSVLEEGIYHA